MPTALPPAHMTAAERLDEVAEILAAGLARLQGLEPGPADGASAAERAAGVGYRKVSRGAKGQAIATRRP